MFKYLLIVEGIADIIFFRDYLQSLYSTLEKKSERLRGANPTIEFHQELILLSENLEIVILESGGCTKLGNIRTRIREYMDDEYTILIIHDTDNKNKDYGGIEARTNYLNGQKKEYNIDFEFFLFPNNSEDGDLETLLLRITQKDKYKQFDDCHTGYINCLEKFIKGKKIKNFRKEKNYIYTYLSLYINDDSAKERNRVYDKTYWDFSSDALIRLKEFFEKNILESK
jgi:hypothetical protein